MCVCLFCNFEHISSLFEIIQEVTKISNTTTVSGPESGHTRVDCVEETPFSTTIYFRFSAFNWVINNQDDAQNLGDAMRCDGINLQWASGGSSVTSIPRFQLVRYGAGSFAAVDRTSPEARQRTCRMPKIAITLPHSTLLVSVGVVKPLERRSRYSVKSSPIED